MQFLIQKQTRQIIVKSSIPLEKLTWLPKDWKNRYIVAKKETTIEEIDRRGGIFYVGQKLVFGDEVSIRFMGTPVSSKADVDRITRTRLSELFGAYGGEDKFKTELAMYSGGLCRDDPNHRILEIIQVRQKILDEGNAFVEKHWGSGPFSLTGKTAGLYPADVDSESTGGSKE